MIITLKNYLQLIDGKQVSPIEFYQKVINNDSSEAICTEWNNYLYYFNINAKNIWCFDKSTYNNAISTMDDIELGKRFKLLLRREKLLKINNERNK